MGETLIPTVAEAIVNGMGADVRITETLVDTIEDEKEE